MGKDRNDRRKKLIASCLLALLLIGGVAAAERLNQMDPASRGLTGTPSGVTFWRAEQEDVEIPDEAAPSCGGRVVKRKRAWWPMGWALFDGMRR